MVQGTRMKASVHEAEQPRQQDARTSASSTLTCGITRKFSRSIIWANRASYGQFFGDRAQQFRLGGMDNWLNADYEETSASALTTRPRPRCSTRSL